MELPTILLADYEGLGVAIAQGFWLLLTVPAFLLALGGVIAATVRHPRRTLARWLGAIACVVELAGVIIVLLAFTDEQARLGAYAERFRPGMVFWAVSVLIIVAGILAVHLGFSRKRQIGPE